MIDIELVEVTATASAIAQCSFFKQAWKECNSNTHERCKAMAWFRGGCEDIILKDVKTAVVQAKSCAMISREGWRAWPARILGCHLLIR